MISSLTLVAIWCAAALISATPLIFVTIGETLVQRTGVINLGCEGAMLGGACAAFSMAATTGNPWLGMAAGGATGMALALLHGMLILGAGANQLASGIAVWMLALGVTSYAGRSLVGLDVPALPSFQGSGVDALPIIGPGLAQMGVAVPMAIATVMAASLWLARTRPGLAWRVVGESADIARENGINPNRARLAALLVGGCLAGLGGAILSVDYTQTWANDITKGRGLIAVGLVIVARWKPVLVLPACFLFGLAETASLRLPAMGIEISSYILAAMPYLVVLFAIVLNQILASVAVRMPADLRKVFDA